MVTLRFFKIIRMVKFVSWDRDDGKLAESLTLPIEEKKYFKGDVLAYLQNSTVWATYDPEV